MLEILVALCLLLQSVSTGLLARHAILEKKRQRTRAARSLPFGL